MVNKSTQAADTLSKAVIRAARLLDIKQAKLAEILGISAVTASRLVAGDYKLQPNRKEWEFGALLVRIIRSLDALLGHGDQAHTWLNGRNLALGDTPAALLESAEGLVSVLHYLDAACLTQKPVEVRWGPLRAPPSLHPTSIR